MDKYLSGILAQFGVKEEDIKEIAPYGDGHINSTYRVVADKVYLLQKINHIVFTNPEKLMENFVAVTEYLHDIIIKDGGNPERGSLTVLKTLDGKNLYKTDEGEYYRLLIFIDAISINSTEDPEVLSSVASAFGKFQKMLANYPADTLFEVIPKFHNTVKRFADLEQAIADDKAGRLASVKAEVEYARSMKERIGVVVDGIADGSIPLRVTHNDTKLNNVLVDKDTLKCVCVIDLDTIMPGSYLYDYGDALRFAGSSAAEDETDLSKVYFDMDKFRAFTDGYLSETKNVLNEKEIELLPFSVVLLTYECGIRFLTDYLNGDTYFRIHREHHNLERARNQFALAQNADSKLDEMAAYIANIVK